MTTTKVAILLAFGVMTAIAGTLFLSESMTTADPDEELVSQLRAAGADLSKPAHTLFYIYVSTEDGAKRVAGAVSDKGLQAEVRPAAIGGGWLCLLQGQLVPSLDNLKKYRSRFERLAQAEGGEYDGWEASVVK